MAIFNWTTNPLALLQEATSTAFNAILNMLGEAIAQTPSNVDPSQLGFFNIGSYGVNSTSLAAANTTAMNQACTDMSVLGGGTLFIPMIMAAPILVSGQITLANGVVTNISNMVNVYSASNAQMIQQTANNNIFFANQGGAVGKANGLFIHDLALSFALHLTSGAAVYLQNTEDTFVHRVYAKESPNGIVIDNCLHVNVEECDVEYDHPANVNNSVGFMVGNPTASQQRNNQTRLHRCQVEFNDNGTGTATCYLIQSSIKCTIEDCYGYGAPVCFAITGSSVSGNSVEKTTLSNVMAGGFGNASGTGYGILIQPQSSSTTSFVQDTKIIGGISQRAGSPQTDSSVGVFIGLNGNSVNAVADTKLIGHNINNCGLYGLQYDGGTNLQVIGGTFGSNNNAGIAFTGTTYSGFITVKGTDLSASYEGGTGQTNAVYVPSTAIIDVPVLISGCPMMGYGNYWQAVNVVAGAVLANFKVKDCPGYNDQAATIATGATVTSGTAFNGTTIGAHPYYGLTRLSFAYSGTITGLTIKVANNQGMLGPTTLLNSANFYDYELEANEWLEMTWTGGGTVTVAGVGH